MTTLAAEKREHTRKQDRARLRKEGKLPGVFYGPKEEATPISVSRPEFERVWKEAGESTIVTLSGVGEDRDVLIHDVMTDPVLGAPLHVDLYVPEKGKKVQVSVPLEFVGTAPAERELGGTLIKVLHELEIEAMPRNLPHAIEVDVTSIKDFETQIHVRDIKLPEGVEALTDPEEVIALVSEAKEEPEEEAEAPDLSQIEVEEHGKKEDEEGEEESA